MKKLTLSVLAASFALATIAFAGTAAPAKKANSCTISECAMPEAGCCTATVNSCEMSCQK